jgi:glycosyltransferase involved in cell wall biosynthesis
VSGTLKGPETLPQPIKVLYLHSTGHFGGSSRSLLDMIRAFPKGSVVPWLLVQKGQVAEIFRQHGIETTECLGLSSLDNTEYSHYRGKRWLVLLRELSYLPTTCWALWKTKRAGCDPDIIHANDYTLLVPALLAKFLFAKPLVIHCRALQRNNGMRAGLIAGLYRRVAARVVCIDETVLRTVSPTLPVICIHNSFLVPPQLKSDLTSDGLFRVGLVGGLIPAKGIMEFLKAAGLCLQSGMRAEFLVAGDNFRPMQGLKAYLLRKTGFAHDLASESRAFLMANRLDDRVKLLGFIHDVTSFYRSLDVLCFPTHVNAIGRPVYEAAFLGVPSIATVTDPMPDTMIPLRTGIAIPPKDPVLLAAAIQSLYHDRKLLRELGKGAYALAMSNFDPITNSASMLRTYVEVLNGYPRN